MDSTFKKYSINGPINIVRLEGNGKVLYLMFDVHEEPNFQTRCRDSKNLDVDQFLDLVFSQLKSEVDFFIEANPQVLYNTSLETDTSNLNYISNTEKWISRNTKSYPLVRFHHMDFRDYFEHLEFKNIDLISFCDDFKKIMSKLKSSLTTGDTQDKSQKQKIINKILLKYSNKKNNETIMKYINEVYLPYLDKGLGYVNKKVEKMKPKIELLEYPNDKFYKDGYGIDYKTQKKINYEIEVFVHKLITKWLDTFVILTDLYFIRRFIDKDYIKKAILYSGNYHCIHIIQLLVKYFNFKITHAHYSKISVNEINKIILNDDTNKPFTLASYLLPPTLYQCSNLFNFPEWFD